MKKNIKFIICFILLIILIFTLTTSSFAAESSVGGIISSGQSFINAGANSNTALPTEENIRDMSNLIYNVLFILGIVIMCIWGMVLGIKFITGSVAEQAEVKKSLLPYGAGCAMILCGYIIWKVVVNIAQQFT